jgi:Spx/MgsR family transcriptional regulator
MVTIYGIRNCDTMKKAFAWCDEHGVAYEFHDFRKQGVDRERLELWCRHAGWRSMINTRGTTWRKLPPERREITSLGEAVALMIEQPAVIRRPVVETGAQLLLGFDPQLFASFVK